MGQFEPLAGGGKNDGVIAHHVAAAQGVHADHALGPRADIAVAAMQSQLVVGAARRLGQDFAQPPRGSAGRVELLPVMHLDDFLVVILAERFRRDLRQVKKEIHADRKIGREDDGNRPRRRFDRLALVGGMARRADDQRLAVVRRESSRDRPRANDARTRSARRTGRWTSSDVVALVDAGDEFQLRVLSRRAAGAPRPSGLSIRQ